MKKIGIVAWATGENSYGVTMMYVDFFSQFGVVQMIMHNELEARTDLDLLVLPGGPDVDPMRYLDKDEPLSLWVGKPCVFKERFDQVLLPQYIENKTPIFGICRGHQTLAVHFGGKLIQDMDEIGIGHQGNTKDRTERVHNILVNQNIIEALDLKHVSRKPFGVNSIHHQCIDSDNLPEIGQVLAVYTDSKGQVQGTVEAMSYYPEYPAITVQWHPEEIRDTLSYQAIKKLLNI